MAVVETVQPHKIRLPWSLRSKLEISPLAFVGQNAIGLPYIQGQIRNRLDRALQLRMVAYVFNERREPIFVGTPGILETLELDAQQQRIFRISLKDVDAVEGIDRQRLWVTRTRIELSIEA